LSPGWEWWWRLPAADRLCFRVHGVFMVGLVSATVWSEVVEPWPVLTEESRVELRNYMMASKFLNWQVPVELPTEPTHAPHPHGSALRSRPLFPRAWNPEPEPSSRIPSVYQSEFSIRFLSVDREIAETCGLRSFFAWVSTCLTMPQLPFSALSKF
jgi:hypothetical protein